MQLLHCEMLSTPEKSSFEPGLKNQADLNYPIVFLHGFLGDSSEWQFIKNTNIKASNQEGVGLSDNLVIGTSESSLSKCHTCYALDLPGHGKSASINLNNVLIERPKMWTDANAKENENDLSILLTEQAHAFRATSQLIKQTLSHHGIHHYHLVGYSLGARIALFHCLYQSLFQGGNGHAIKSLILESANTGLSTNKDKTARLANDQLWANIFKNTPVKRALASWYQQEVFSSLSSKQKHSLIQKRQFITPKAIADMLLATSLAKQPNLTTLLSHLPMPCHYFVGENDQKFCRLAKTYQEANKKISVKTFYDAGHNIHLEQPVDYIISLEQKLSSVKVSNKYTDN